MARRARAPGRAGGAGVEEVGPIDFDEAALVDGLDGPHYLDVSESHGDAVALARGRGMAPELRTVRMYRSAPPAFDASLVFGVTSLELG